MIKNLLMAASVACVTGCATIYTEADGTFNRMDNTLNGLVGEPIEVAIKTLGIPTAKDTDLNIYEWATTSGDWHCKVTMWVDAEGAISEYDYNGNLGGCKRLYSW